MNQKKLNESDQRDHSQAKSDTLPAGTVVVPPGTCKVCGTKPCNAVHHHFGTCPICHKTDGYLNNRNDHAFICKTHKTYWWVGANLFSSCMDETPEQQRAEQEEIGFASYEKVTPHYVADPEYGFCECFGCANDDVQFNDPALMGTTNWSEGELIEEFLQSYPYMEFTWLCRKLKLAPNEALKRVLAVDPEDNQSCSGTQIVESLKAEAERLTAEGWEPGAPPSTPMTKAGVFTLFNATVKVNFNLYTAWSIYDMAYRSGLETEELCKYLVDYAVTHVLRTFKYMGDQKWLLSPEEIQEAAVHCEWTRKGADSIYTQIREKQEELRQRWEEQQPPEKLEQRQRWYQDYFPTDAEIQEFQEERKKWKWPLVPYVDYCSRCDVSYTGNETACTSCGALRMYTKREEGASSE
jgi:hypothetical protein